MTFLQALDNMLGFVIKQPLHLTLRQMRILPVALLCNAMALLWYIAYSIKGLDPLQAAIAYGAIATTLIPMIFKGIDALHKPHDKDSD